MNLTQEISDNLVLIKDGVSSYVGSTNEFINKNDHRILKIKTEKEHQLFFLLKNYLPSFSYHFHDGYLYVSDESHSSDSYMKIIRILTDNNILPEVITKTKPNLGYAFKKVVDAT